MIRFIITFFVIHLAAGFFIELAAQSVTGISQKDFLHPPLDARPGALWPWLNGHVDKAQISKELSEMKAKGMRGGIIWDLGSLADPEKIIPSGPAFLGKESLDAIKHAMDESSRLGLELGLVASSSWNAGGSWVQPNDGSKILLWSETKLTGPQLFNDTLALPLKTNAHHSDVVILAIPDDKDSIQTNPGNIQNITKFFSSGKLKWQVPKGKWNIMRFVNSNTGQLLMCPSPNSNGLMIDHLSADAVVSHLTFMLNKLKEGRKDFGALKYFFFDSYELDEGTDWTENFLKKFRDMYGYDATLYLPALSGKTIGSKELTARFMHDYHKAVSDFIIENHFRMANSLLNKNGIKLIAEAGHGGSARVDVLKALGAVDIPMGEFWNHQRFWVTKEAASAAHIYGKKLVPAESLTGWQHWKHGPSEYKRLVDIAFCAGLNQVTFHTFTHNPPEAGLPGYVYHAGEHFNVNTTWWNVSKPMLDYFSRCSYMLQQGEFVADVCFYYGDQAPNLVPSRRIDPSVKPIYDSSSCLHCGRPRPVHVETLGPGYDYDYVNEEVILKHMRGISGGVALSHGMKYRVLVLPDHNEISLEVIRKLEKITPPVMKKLKQLLIESGAAAMAKKSRRTITEKEK
jgi:hypothetical protein